ncbi:MAG: hypothetical protein HZB16_13255 [Armatimonadetes bacterium]|nr:hypothetical protein [Armatimonadota bacterium]
MPEFGPLIADIVVGQNVRDVPVYVQEATARTKKDGGTFGSYTFRDRTGALPAVDWNQSPEEGEQGAIALVSGRVGEFKGERQLSVQSLYLVDKVDERILERLREPVDAARQAWLIGVMERCAQHMAPGFWAIFREALGHDPFDLEGPFWTWAAGEKMHHTGLGGLAWHVLTMLDHVDSLAPAYPNLDVDMLRLAVLCHDLGKIDAYDMGLVAARRLPLDSSVGHTAISMMRVSTAIGRLREQGQIITASDEENLLHCLAAHHGRREWGAIVEPVSAEAAALHALDLIDSRLRCTDQITTPLPERLAAPPSDRAPRRRSSPEPAAPASQASLFED